MIKLPERTDKIIKSPARIRLERGINVDNLLIIKLCYYFIRNKRLAFTRKYSNFTD